MGGWSVRHRKTAIVGWLLFVAAAALAAGVGQEQMTPDEYAAGDSARAVRILDEAGLVPGASEMLLVHSEAQTADAAGFRLVVGELVRAVSADDQVIDVKDPYEIGLISADRHSALIQFGMKGEADTAYERVQPVLVAVAAVRAAHPEVRIEQFGDASGTKWVNDTVFRDFKRAEWTAVPLALGILLVAFGALLAAVLPVGLALTAFLAANGLLALVSHVMHLDTSASSVMLLIGLAVGVDYCLFYLRREREERAAGRDKATALRIAAATSGRAVLVSGATVVIAMSGMFLSGMLLYNGFAIATIMVVLIAMLGSVTVLPATLSLLGDKVNLGRIPGLWRLSRGQGDGRVWGAVLRRVLARPGLSSAASAVVLLALAAPVVGIRTEKLGLEKVLPGTPIVETYQHISTAFPGGPMAAQVVVRADDIEAPAVARAIDAFTAAAKGSGYAHEPIQVSTHAAMDV
jgi:RND superfamily putative drug exporter